MNTSASLFGVLPQAKFRLLLLLTLSSCWWFISSVAAADTVVGWGNNNNRQTDIPIAATNVAALSGGTLHSLALRRDGTAIAWGDNGFGQTNVSGLAGLRSAKAGGTFSLFLHSNGTLTVRGTLPAPPAGLSNITAIAAGWSHALALRGDGTVVSWGDSNSVPAGLSNVTAIAAGDGHSLALLQNRTVVAWGDTNFNKTIVPAGLTNVLAIAAGKDHSLALRWNGLITAWGRNDEGQTNIPPSATNIVALSGGGLHSLALRAAGTATAWGDNLFNQGFAPALSGFRQITAGGYHNLGLVGDPSPVITLQPFSQAVPYTKTAFFPVLAAGTPPLHYQWRKDGTNMPGRTTSLLILTNLQASDAATYSVVVTNASGVVISDGAVLTPYFEPPVVLNQPLDAAVVCGRSTNFLVEADGFAPLSYQWLFAGTPIADATNAVLNLPNVTLDQAGGYAVVITNIAGVLTSQVATLTVTVIPPVITNHPSSTNVICGETASFSVEAEGINPLQFQWMFQGDPIPGATESTLVLSNVHSSQAGEYYVMVFDQCAAVPSDIATLTVQVEQPLITSSLTATGVQCRAFSYEITALYRPILFDAVGLPAGLTLDPTNGIISGFPAAEGTFTPVISAINNCATQSETLTLEFSSGAAAITSPLTASGRQGDPFLYQITAIYEPIAFDAAFLPLGLTIDTNSGVIAGIPLEPGTFQPVISAINTCVPYSTTLTLNFTSGAPVITSSALVVGEEEQPLLYQIEATRDPTAFAAQNLPEGLSFDPATGLIQGKPIYGRTQIASVSASNQWGWGEPVNVVFAVSNRPISGLSIANVTYTYSSPYVLDFEFSLRDNDDPSQGNAVVVSPQLLTTIGKENDFNISASETGTRVALGSTKLLKANLVLDFSESLASLNYGDADQDGLSDAIEEMVAGAQAFVNQQSAAAQIGVYEFHREDFSPSNVVALTTDKARVNSAIAGIWTNQVQGFPAASRCWDALLAAINNLGTSNRDEQHYVVFISDGEDESSTATLGSVLTAATNNGVKILAIGFGDAVNTANLALLTSLSNGRFYTAANAEELAAQFARVSKDLYGQYILRWATLKRTATQFQPSFKLSYQGFTALSPTNPVTPAETNIDNSTMPPTTNIIDAVTNYIIGLYSPTANTGVVTRGALRLAADAAVSPTAIRLRMAYTPRFVRQIRFQYRANWPCTTELLSTSPGEILHGWSMTETNDGTGGKWVLLSAPYPASTTNSIPFAAFGDLVHFKFQDIVNPSNAFSVFRVDTNLATYTGGQHFFLENSNAFITVLTNLPHGTPLPWLAQFGLTNNPAAQELGDPDGDGVPTWQEYRGNTNPTNSVSKFAVRGLATDEFGRYFITFSTATNRRYRLESSFDLVDWEIIEADIIGQGADVTILDHRYHPWEPHVFYRVRVHD